MDFETLLMHGGIAGDENTGAVNVPIYHSTTYRQDAIGKQKQFHYARAGNPTRHALEELTARMEEGTAGFAFASGMAAITAVLMLFHSGDKILLSDRIYGGTFRVVSQVFRHFGLQYEMVDAGDPGAVTAKIDGQVKAIYIETPANPLLGITDIAQVTQLARDHGLMTIADNTFMTPYLQKPLTLGVDIVIHSASKYLGGHSDLLGGLVIVKRDDLAERIGFLQKATGGILSPHDSWLLMRGIRTLSVRMDRHMENAQYIAEFLKGSEAVDSIYFPGLHEHRGYDIHRRQAKGPGGVVSFTLREGCDMGRFISALKIITFGESLGGVESLLTHPATMSHHSVPPETRLKMGITDRLVRLSAGIESKHDLAEDIRQALDKASS